jgi:hypothetical protein
MLQEDCHYIHLSALKTRPSLAVALPPKCPTAYPNGIVYPTRKGVLAVTAPQADVSVPGDAVEYLPTRKASVRERMGKGREKKVGESGPTEVSRLLLVEGLEVAMREWDGEALRLYVELLALNVIRTERGQQEGGVMKPGIFVLQGWEDN